MDFGSLSISGLRKWLLRLIGKDTGILSLPNELLIQILSYLPPLQLMRLCTLCRRIRSLILYIVHQKIQHTLNPDKCYVELVCSWMVDEDLFLCGYLKTCRVGEPVPRPLPHRDQQVTVNNGNNIGIEAEPKHISNFGTSSIGSLYSHFSLTRRLDNNTIISPTRLVPTRVCLHKDKPFINFCARGFLFGPGLPPFGLRPVVVLFFERGIPVKREWLQDAEKATSRYFSVENIDMLDTISNEESDSTCSRILWFDSRKVAGLKVRVREQMGVRETKDFSHSKLYEVFYEALLVRTVHLLMEWSGRNVGG